ncbi:MAG: phosphatidylserine decarboxylase [Planctomycetota bacterium]|jgi:phosphatidylserine decarboxylase
MRWPFTPYGTGPLLLLSAVLAAAAWLLATSFSSPLWALAALPPWLFVLSFFRDPERHAEGGEDLLVSPADGLVSDIVTLDDPALDVPATRIGIFLSVFNVHVNRAPCGGDVVNYVERPGGYHDARDERAIEGNRATTIVIARPDGRCIGVRQITGLIARRIVCPVTVGQALARGERYGMIRFGSRTELIVETAALDEVLVQVGQKVQGGRTLLARLAAPSSPTSAATQTAGRDAPAGSSAAG